MEGQGRAEKKTHAHETKTTGIEKGRIFKKEEAEFVEEKKV